MGEINGIQSSIGINSIGRAGRDMLGKCCIIHRKSMESNKLENVKKMNILTKVI